MFLLNIHVQGWQGRSGLPRLFSLPARPVLVTTVLAFPVGVPQETSATVRTRPGPRARRWGVLHWCAEACALSLHQLASSAIHLAVVSRRVTVDKNEF